MSNQFQLAGKNRRREEERDMICWLEIWSRL